MIEARGLVKRYDNHLAVDHLSFTIEKGHIVGFLGPNGAGKSTTMNMITGYIAATEGTVTINGHDIYEEPQEAKKSIGYLPELPPLYQNMKVREYLLFVAELKGVARSEKKAMVEEIIKRVHLEEYANRLIKQLSKGYKQRVGLAQAIVGYPEVLILDEPTVGLDPLQIIEIRDLIKELAKEHTIILSSHIMQEISAVCDTVMIINKGKLLVNDKTENLSKYITVSKGLQMEVQGDKHVINETLKSIEEITKVVYKKTEDGMPVAFTAYAEDGTDIRAKLFPALAAVNCQILTMKDEEMTLEDIFLQLTKNATEENAEAAVEETADAQAENEETAEEENEAIAAEETAAEESEAMAAEEGTVDAVAEEQAEGGKEE